MPPTRRQVLHTLAATSVFPLPLGAAAEGNAQASSNKLRIGLITDIHKDIIHDADARLTAFIDAMLAEKEKVDAIMQLGDFCIPKPVNRDFLAIFNRFPGPKYHVLGNHDMDGGFKREQAVAFLGMPARYYSFDLGGCHFIVLDGNDMPPDWKGGYPAYLAADQVAWLEKDLAATQLNTFIISHQSLEHPSCIANQAEVRKLIAAARTAEGKPKVAACFNGHWHIDHARRIDGIPYVHLNSASYFWMGSEYRSERLEPELAKKFPHVSSTAPYAKPLFTVLEIDPAAGKFSLRAAPGEWLKPDPAELHYSNPVIEPDWIRPEIRAVDSARV
ncbi:metallophosphoesterase [Haloferula sp. BvORR071]|uniref:metallophosphoesterase family protein n=1 Tax=Haloferula sp. BvORR071 TaxID=1396141 RepID=UPI000698C457|nr:metallophosphoesterase [Haloferula sp. BvORR071]